MSSEEVDLVVKLSDKGVVKDGLIDKTELVRAITVWFSDCQPDGASAGEADLPTQEHQAPSSDVSVSPE